MSQKRKKVIATLMMILILLNNSLNVFATEEVVSSEAPAPAAEEPTIVETVQNEEHTVPAEPTTTEEQVTNSEAEPNTPDEPLAEVVTPVEEPEKEVPVETPTQENPVNGEDSANTTNDESISNTDTTSKEDEIAEENDKDTTILDELEETTDEETDKDLKDEEDDDDLSITMPAATFEKEIEEVHVHVKVTAGIGVFPANTRMEAKLVEEEKIIDKLDEAVDEFVDSVIAVDITFFNENNEEIEPASNVNVEITSDEIIQMDNPTIIHVDDNGNTNLVNKSEAVSEENKVSFDANSFSIYAVVGTISTEIISANGNLYEVTVTYTPEADIPKDSRLQLTEYKEGDPGYEEAKKALFNIDYDTEVKQIDESIFEEELVSSDGEVPLYQIKQRPVVDEEHEEYGIEVFDITILNKDGQPIEPKAPVDVYVKLKELPKDVDREHLRDTLTVSHLNESSGTISVETVASADANHPGKLEIVSNQMIAEFKVDSFSTFTVSWGSGWSSERATVHYVDESGNELTISNSGTPSASSSPSYLIYDINDYEYSYTYINNSSSRIRPLLYWYNNNWYGLDTSNNWKQLSNNDNIYVVYKRKQAPTQGGTPKLKDVNPEDRPDQPSILKNSKSNGDGTSDLSLSIRSNTKPREVEKLADVIVVFDASGSMGDPMGSSTRIAAAKNAVNALAKALIDGDDTLIRMGLVTFSNTATVAKDFTSDYDEFKNAVNSINTGGGTNWEKALYEANKMSVDPERATFVIFVTDGDPTFRMTRGTISNDVDVNSSYYVDYNVYGTGSSDESNRNYTAALAEALKVVGANKTLYTIGISNDVTKVENFGNAAGSSGNYKATTIDDLEQAFEDIKNSITATMGYSTINMTDGITELTNTVEKTGLVGVGGDFTYYKAPAPSNWNEMTAEQKKAYTPPESGAGAFVEWNPSSEKCLEAEYDESSGSVKWNMGPNFMPEDGVTYKVTFKVWPSQEAYDILAKCENDPNYYDTLTPAEKAQIKKDGDTYTLKTNKDGANTTYKSATKSGTTITLEGDEIRLDFNTVPDLNLASKTINIKKEWSNILDGREETETYEFKVTADGTEFFKVNLSNSTVPPWEQDGIHISTGLMTTTGENTIIYEKGHDYTVVEPVDLSYYWDFKAEVYHPMVIDNQPRMLIRVDNAREADYTIDYSTDTTQDVRYYKLAEENATLKAKNDRRSYLNLSKALLDESGNEITGTTLNNYKDEEFKFDVTITDLEGGDIWFSAYDSINGVTVKNDYSIVNGTATAEEENGVHSGYFYAPSGTTLKLTLKPGWNYRFINLRLGTTYTITENDIDSNSIWEFNNIDKSATNGGTPATANGKTANGTIDKSNANFTVDYKNKLRSDIETEASVKKVWDDNNNQDGIRPNEIKVKLSNGTEVTLNESNSWEAKIEHLPKYSGGQEITYTWSEENVPTGYTLTGNTASGTVTTITNSHTPEETEASVKKVWDDNNNQDGIRPNEIKVKLSNGTEVTLNESNSWEAKVEHLPKYSGGQEITYTWSEENVPTGYTLTGNTASGTVTTITNSHTPDETEASVKKVWDDNNNQDGIRPNEIKVKLSNGTEVTLNESNSWEAKVEHLPKYSNGVEISYTWSEENVPTGYTLTGNTASGTVTTLTNSHTPEETEASVKKVWDDNNNQDGIRPNEIKVKLSNGTEVTLNESNSWEAKVEHLPKYSGGQEITYTWSEENVPTGYTLTGNTASGTVTTITNSHTPEETEASVKKVWDDNNNQDGIRPNEIKVKLSNGTEVTLNESNSWEEKIENLPKYDKGVEISYTWSEDSISDGYTLTNNLTEGTITTITNSHIPEETEAVVTKIWDDNENQDGLRPNELKVTLSNGAEVILNEANSWTEKIQNLPKYENGNEIEYTWEEDLPEGYELFSTSKDGVITALTNKHIPGTVSISVTKTWDDLDNKFGLRPESITVRLNANGKEVKAVKINEKDNNWKYTFNNLDEYSNGEKIKYSISEDDISYYTATITKNSEKDYTITNKIIPMGGQGNENITIVTQVVPLYSSNPATRSKDNTILYISLIAVASLAVVISTIVDKNRDKKIRILNKHGIKFK